jgi:hypothetical protein
VLSTEVSLLLYCYEWLYCYYIIILSRQMFTESRQLFTESRQMFTESRQMFTESRQMSTEVSLLLYCYESPTPSRASRQVAEENADTQRWGA